jgi:hypothetical protein
MRKSLRLFKTDEIFKQQKNLILNQIVVCDHATMQKNVLLHFWVIFLLKLGQNIKKLFCCSRAFLLSTLKQYCCPALELFSCLSLWKQ